MHGQTVIETPTGWMIHCRECQWHEIPKVGRPGATWSFNGDFVRPTFSPSVNEVINPKDSPDHRPDVPTRRCHYIITEGRIQYCGDCTHKLAGQTLPLEAWPPEKVRYYAALLQRENPS